MMNAAARLQWELGGSKVQEWHRDRLAVVYVRQSTMAQVIEHGESTRLQYGLSGRAAEPGGSPVGADNSVIAADLVSCAY
jgi:hypothetical protein